MKRSHWRTSGKTVQMQIKYTREFKRRLKTLGKKYRKIKHDIQPVLSKLQQGDLAGDKIQGIGTAVFKLRVKNSDIPTGKRGGYRIIYWLKNSDEIILISIYAKTMQIDISDREIIDIIQAFDNKV